MEVEVRISRDNMDKKLYQIFSHVSCAIPVGFGCGLPARVRAGDRVRVWVRVRVRV